jgi:hypothetical protein
VDERQASALPDVRDAFVSRPPRFSEGFRLVATRSAISCAGLFVASTLAKWRLLSILPEATTETEALVTSAVKQTGMMDERPRWTEISHLNFIMVRLVGLEASVVIEIWDCDPDNPTLASPAGAVVNRGSYRLGSGKIVWVELTVFPQSHQNPDLLRRVRDGLEKL